MDSLLSQNSNAFEDVFELGEMYNGEITGVPCHLYDMPWTKGKLIADFIKKVQTLKLTKCNPLHVTGLNLPLLRRGI